MMPTYEYECDKCKRHFDLFHSMTDTRIQKCPKCGGKTHRLISGGTGVIFKGTGFYDTDYRKKSGSDSSPKPSCPSDCKHCPSNPSTKKSKSD
jgi:putative FmdB family regulatory protein